MAAGPPVGQGAGRRVPLRVVEAVRVGRVAVVERRREGAQVRGVSQPVARGVGGHAFVAPDRVHRLGGDADPELLHGHERDGHARVRDAVQLCRQRRAVLVRVAQDDVRPPLLYRRPKPRQRGPRVEAAEDLAHDHAVRLLLRQFRHPRPDLAELVLGRRVELPKIEAGAAGRVRQYGRPRHEHLMTGALEGARERHERIEMARAAGRGEQHAHV